ncbi:MAG: hypothetical protein KF756_08410 [Acidobacteria bacterium]|nr:hypothetical protein [Acidobacteriota bacterium]
MEAVVENPICAACGADVREGTSFCYACGKPVNGPAIEPPTEDVAAPAATAEPPEVRAKADLEAAFAKAEKESAADAASEEANANRVRAARERQAARLAKRKPGRTEWAEPADASGIGIMIMAAAIFVITAIIVVYLEVFK